MESRAMQQSLDAPGPLMPWLTHERRNWLAVVAIAGLAGFGAGNGHTTQGAISHISTQLGDTKGALKKVQAHDNCVTHQANLGKAFVYGKIADPDVVLDANCPPQPKVK